MAKTPFKEVEIAIVNYFEPVTDDFRFAEDSSII